jgi:hypothetical protein
MSNERDGISSSVGVKRNFSKTPLMRRKIFVGLPTTSQHPEVEVQIPLHAFGLDGRNQGKPCDQIHR